MFAGRCGVVRAEYSVSYNKINQAHLYAAHAHSHTQVRVIWDVLTSYDSLQDYIPNLAVSKSNAHTHTDIHAHAHTHTQEVYEIESARGELLAFSTELCRRDSSAVTIQFA